MPVHDQIMHSAMLGGVNQNPASDIIEHFLPAMTRRNIDRRGTAR